MKTLIVYLYKEDENTKKNLEFFLQHGVYDDIYIDYHIIINDHTCTLDIPKFIQVHYQDNALDFPSYKTLFSTIKYAEYDYFYFINSSCIGPFLPVYCDKQWFLYLNRMLGKYDIIGPIAEVPIKQDNFTNNPFIHTYMFGLNKHSIKIFIDCLNQYDIMDKDVCIYFERYFQNEILSKNLKIKSLLTLFKNIDLNNTNNWNSFLWNETENSCYEIPENYYGIDINPYEIMFVKNIRNSHSHRGENISGISKYLGKQLKNYISWINQKDILS